MSLNFLMATLVHADTGKHYSAEGMVSLIAKEHLNAGTEEGE